MPQLNEPQSAVWTSSIGNIEMATNCTIATIIEIIACGRSACVCVPFLLLESGASLRKRVTIAKPSCTSRPH